MVPALIARARKLAPDLLLLAVVLGFGLWRFRALLGCEHACLQDYARDLPYEFYTIHLYARQALEAGSFPFWDPHIMAGHPVGAQFGNSLLYAPLWLWLVLTGPGPFTPRAEELLLVWHVVGAAGSVYLAARMLRFGRVGALMAGLLMAGMPQSFPMLQWPPMIFGIPWVPLILAAWIRLCEAPRASQALPFAWILAIAGALLLTAAHPNLPAYTWLSMALIGGLVLVRDALIRRRGPLELARHALELGIAACLPVALAAFFVLPLLTDLPLLARYVLPFHATMGYLEPARAWNLVFPYSSELGLCSFGPLALGLALGSSLFLRRKGSLAWTLPLLAGFWLLYMIEGSPVFAAMRPVPLMGTMRYATRAVVVIAVLLALVGGELAAAIARDALRGPSLRPSLSWLLPASVVATLLWAWKAAPVTAEQLEAGGAHGPWTLALGLVAAPCLLLLARGPKRRMAAGAAAIAIAIAAFVELDSWAPFAISGEETGPMEPHASLVSKARERFPEVFDEPSLDRHCDWGHHNVVPYLTGTHATSGLTWPWFRTAYTASPANYYFLWSDDWPGTKDSLYTKASPSLDAGIYDLLGVRWFLFSDNREWVYLSRRPGFYEHVADEWVQLDAAQPLDLSGAKAELSCDFVERSTVRGRVRLEVNGQAVGDDKVASSGDPLVWMLPADPVHSMRLVLVRKGMHGGDEGPTDLALGCKVTNFRPLGTTGQRIPAEGLAASASSGTVDLEGLLDSGSEAGWQPDLDVQQRALLTQGAVREIRPGLYENEDVLPRALLVYDWEVVEDADAAWAELREDEFDPTERAWFEEDPGLPPPPATPGSGQAELTGYGPNTIEVELNTDAPALLLLGELASPGWRAQVDGKRRPVLTADGAFRAVFVEPGDRLVRLVYRPPGFGLGVLFSLLSLLALAGASAWRWRRGSADA